MTIFAVPTLAGTPADLRDIVLFLDPDEQIVGLDVRLRAIAICLLVDLQAEDNRGMREERERYESIATLARQLQEKLAAVAWPGMLLNPLGRTRAVHEKQPPQRPKQLQHRVCALLDMGEGSRTRCSWLAGRPRMSRPVCQAAPVRRRSTLDRGDALAVFSRVCAELLQDVTRKPPAISEDGKLADLVSRLCRYAVGTDEPEPVGIGHHAKKAAGKLRKKIRCELAKIRPIHTLKTSPLTSRM